MSDVCCVVFGFPARNMPPLEKLHLPKDASESAPASNAGSFGSPRQAGLDHGPPVRETPNAPRVISI